MVVEEQLSFLLTVLHHKHHALFSVVNIYFFKIIFLIFFLYLCVLLSVQYTLAVAHAHFATLRSQAEMIKTTSAAIQRNDVHATS